MKEKAIYINQTFYWLLIIFISSLILYNSGILIKTHQAIALLPIAIQTGLLILIFIKSKLVKIALQVWTVIFLIIGNGFIVLGDLMQFFGGKSNAITGVGFSLSVCLLFVGIAVLIFINKTIMISKEE